MKYIVYWYEKDESNKYLYSYLYSSEEFESLEEARLHCNRLYSNQTTAVIKDLDGNIVEVKE